MPATKAIGRANVDDERTREAELGERIGRWRWQLGACSEHWRPLAIDVLHHAEVGRRLGLSFENAVDERVDVSLGEGPVRHSLVTYRRRGHVAERLAARASRAMRRPDLEIVRELADATERQEELPRA